MINAKEFTILIVDDVEKNIQLLGKVLTETGYNVDFATSGQEALDWLEEKEFDLVLLDIMMPGMDGFEVCKIIREKKKYENLPILFLTAKAEKKSAVKGFKLGSQDYITKPFDIDELLARVETHLKLKKSQDDIRQYLGEIEEKNKEISDSINYAKRIQQASLPSDIYLRSILKDYFIIYRPKDVVSGDFYWIKQIDSKLVIIIADCTGHGVPGAFMSMFGTAFLNEIVSKNSIIQPSFILDKLREMVISSLQQNENTVINDGMDISIITVDKENGKLEYAGAKNNLYQLREGVQQRIKADSMPVGPEFKVDPFKNNELEIQTGDVYYLLTDGYEDQFGGPKNKKLGRKALTQLMLDHYDKNMKDQKLEFETYFDDWKGDEFQVDDVLVFGIRI